jgi:AraC-like DNA-binding protein
MRKRDDVKPRPRTPQPHGQRRDDVGFLDAPGEDLDAASAGYRAGYGDASHFNREYKRLFGAPPVRNVERLRNEAATVGASL